MEQEYFEKIHRYLNGQMDAHEKADFEAGAAQNPTLAADLAAERLLLRGLELHGDAQLRRHIHDAHTRLEREGFFSQIIENQTVAPLKITFMKRILAYAAAAAVLLVVGWFAFLQPSRPSADELIARFHDPKDPHIGAVMQGLESQGLAPVATPDDTLLATLRLFEAGKYAEAQRGLDTFRLDHPTNDTATYYLALAHFNQSRYARALELLTEVSSHEGFAFRHDARWTLGLCYLKTEGGEEKAVEIFEELQASSDFPRHREARAMRDMIGH